MATRAERMQQRLRGAQRHQVEVGDLDFGGLFPADSFPVAEAPPVSSDPISSSSPVPLPPPGPHQHADPSPKPVPAPVPTKTTLTLRRSPRNATAEQPDPAPVQAPAPKPAPIPSDPPVDPDPELATNARPPSPVPDDFDDLPTNTPHRLSVHEITESPSNAPGSGHRRPIPHIPSSTNRLQSLMSDHNTDDLAAMNSSSPLTRKSRMASREKTRVSRAARMSRLAQATTQEMDELSPEADKIARKPVTTRLAREILASPEPEETMGIRMEEEEEPPVPVDAQFSEDEAEEIGDEEAASKLGRNKRQRQESPELHGEPARQSSPFVAEPIEIGPSPTPSPEPELVVQPPQKRTRRRQESLSPSQSNNQSQDTVPRSRTKKSKKSHTVQADHVSNRLHSLDDQTTIPIAVQRFKLPRQIDGDDTDDLASDIPCTSRSGVNTVDVLNQVCEEVLDTSLSQLLALLPTADAAAKKDIKAKVRALEAFQEELRSRLLSHTIYLDTLHGLKKRLRKAAADKARLRGEILRLRQEREQVALRMDAARARHEENTNGLQRRLNMSTVMHDVEMVLGTGEGAEELEKREEKDVELGNLEMVVAGVAEEASRRGVGGGALAIVKEFNRFLERVAMAMEGR